MRTFTPALAALLLVGCADQPVPTRPTAAVHPAVAPSGTTSSRAGLGFDPPVAAQTPAPDLSRDARAPAADNGIQPATTTYNVTTSLQDDTDDGSYSQQSVTQRTGTVQR